MICNERGLRGENQGLDTQCTVTDDIQSGIPLLAISNIHSNKGSKVTNTESYTIVC